jgi:hypothetical protein
MGKNNLLFKACADPVYFVFGVLKGSRNKICQFVLLLKSSLILAYSLTVLLKAVPSQFSAVDRLHILDYCRIELEFGRNDNKK